MGKDADLVIAKGCPMHIAVKPQTVFVDGKRAFALMFIRRTAYLHKMDMEAHHLEEVIQQHLLLF